MSRVSQQMGSLSGVRARLCAWVDGRVCARAQQQRTLRSWVALSRSWTPGVIHRPTPVSGAVLRSIVMGIDCFLSSRISFCSRCSSVTGLTHTTSQRTRPPPCG